jgi:hypothetical protein
LNCETPWQQQIKTDLARMDLVDAQLVKQNTPSQTVLFLAWAPSRLLGRKAPTFDPGLTSVKAKPTWLT